MGKMVIWPSENELSELNPMEKTHQTWGFSSFNHGTCWFNHQKWGSFSMKKRNSTWFNHEPMNHVEPAKMCCPRSSCCHSSWERSEFCRPQKRGVIRTLCAARLERRCMMRPSYEQCSKPEMSSLCSGSMINPNILDRKKETPINQRDLAATAHMTLQMRSVHSHIVSSWHLHSSASFWVFQKLPKGVLVVVEPWYDISQLQIFLSVIMLAYLHVHRHFLGIFLKFIITQWYTHGPLY